jgi:lysophospholipase D
VDIPLATDSFYKIIKKFTTGSCLKSCLGCVIYQILNCFNFLGRIWIRHLKKRGILTFYFILNSEEDFDTAVASGCSGIMTDYPSQLNAYLKRNNLFFV